MKVILTGSIAIDYLMKFPGLFSDHLLPEHLDKVSLSFLVPELSRRDGGVGANIAYTLAMLGGEACLFSTAGQDFPDYAKRLEAVGVVTSCVRIIQEKFTVLSLHHDQHNARSQFLHRRDGGFAILSLKKVLMSETIRHDFR